MIQVLSYGGGIQSVSMCVLVATEVLPRPEYIIFADTSREVDSTSRYMSEVMEPYLKTHDLKIETASHDLATVDTHNKYGDIIMPVFTERGKLPTYCSNEWKLRVVQRFLRSRGEKYATMWIGFSADETSRSAKQEINKGWTRTFPLRELGLTRTDCERVIQAAGLPLPLKSRCWCCPHQQDREWASLSSSDRDKAIQLDKEIRDSDYRGTLFLHELRVPLDEALEEKTSDRPLRPCDSGMCFL